MLILGLASCTTTGPTVTLSGPAGPYIIGEGTITLTATGNPGSSAGLWTYSFSAACGTFNSVTTPPANQTTVATVFTPTTEVPNCVITVTLTTASGRKATASITRSVGYRPTVVSTVPANSTSNVPVITGSISVTFSHAMDPSSLVLTCTGEADGPGYNPPSWSPCNLDITGPTGGPTTFTWTVSDPDATPGNSLQYGRAYRLQVSGQRASPLLIPMAAPYVFAFDTEPLLAGIVINKSAVNANGTFTYTSTIPGNATFSITTTGGSGSRSFTNLPPGTYTVTEDTPPTGWEFTSLICSDPTGNTTVDPVTRTATINLDPGETVICTYTNTYIIPLLPACTYGEVADYANSGEVKNYPIAGNPGDRAFAYVQHYDTVSPYYDDSILHLRSTPLTTPSNCPASRDLECDDDDGATYNSLGGTFIAYDLNSLIAGHPLATTNDVVSAHGWGGDPLGEPTDPYRLYRHVVPAANLVVYTIDPPGAVPVEDIPAVPETPTPWMIGQSITSGDADWYRFRVDTAPVALFVALDTSPDTPTSPHDDVSSWYGVIELRDGNGNLLQSTSNRYYIGPSPYGDALAIRINAPGTYIIAVRWYGSGPTPAEKEGKERIR